MTPDDLRTLLEKAMSTGYGRYHIIERTAAERALVGITPKLLELWEVAETLRDSGLFMGAEDLGTALTELEEAK